MRSFLFVMVTIFAVFLQRDAIALSALYCGNNVNGYPDCITLTGQASVSAASQYAFEECTRRRLSNCTYVGSTPVFTNQCWSAASPLNGTRWFGASGQTSDATEKAAIAGCQQSSSNTLCTALATVCDTATASDTPVVAPEPSDSNPVDYGSLGSVAAFSKPNFLRDLLLTTIFYAIETPVGLAFGFLIIIIALAKYRVILNYFVHGNLPYKLTNYADDIEMLFTRTQRVNWYGRVVFGVVARLGMTDRQLLLVRRYWLGRVIAFDSFRRQRQNELARMHLQLAAAGGAPPPRAKPPPLLWIILKRIFLSVFYLLRSLVSFLFGFLFIRVTIAKLARGKLVETKDLALLLEAKTAIEETAGYLKEYLEVAETFDGQEELFEPRGPIHAVLEAIHGRREAQPQGNASPIRRGRGAVSS